MPLVLAFSLSSHGPAPWGSRCLSGGGGAGRGEKTVVIIEPARTTELSPLVLDLHGLTDREREITQFLLRGPPAADIARRLFIGGAPSRVVAVLDVRQAASGTETGDPAERRP